MSWTSLLIFVSASLLTMCVSTWIYDYFFRYRLEVRQRLHLLSVDKHEDSVSLFKTVGPLPEQNADGICWRQRVQHLLEQAGVQWSPEGFLALSVGVAAITASLGMYVGWWLSVILALIGAWVPWGVVGARRQSRRRKLCRQLPEAFEMISRAVRAGQTVPSALQIVAQDFEPPIRDEFAHCYEQQNLGISRALSLRQLAQRTGIMELQIFVVALLVQAKSGGDLVELLNNLSAMVRNRLKLTQRVRALTGEGRMQALVLTVLPILALVGALVLAPDYAQCLLDRPWLLVGTAATQLVGALWVRQIVNFEF